jgi:hypothetical protein
MFGTAYPRNPFRRLTTRLLTALTGRTTPTRFGLLLAGLALHNSFSFISGQCVDKLLVHLCSPWDHVDKFMWNITWAQLCYRKPSFRDA